jgi:cell division protein FtsZ
MAPPLSVVQPQLRTGTDNIPVLNQMLDTGRGQPGQPHASHGGSHAGHIAGETRSAPSAPDYANMATPSVWRTRSQAAAKVDALVNNGMDEIEIPAFLRKQAD